MSSNGNRDQPGGPPKRFGGVDPAPFLAVAALALVAGLALVISSGASDTAPSGYAGIERAAAQPDATAGVGAAAEGEPACPADPELIAERMAELRGLAFERTPKVECLPLEQVPERARELSREAGRERPDPETAKGIRREAAASTEILKLAGLAPPSFDSGGDVAGSVGLEAAGVYVPGTDTVLIAPGPDSERYLAHELLHALEDQRFETLDLEPSGSSEADSGLQALVEGSATFYELSYAERYLDSGVSPSEAISSRSLLEAPATSPALRQYLLFPYLAGGQFVAALVERGGNELVDEAAAEPPISSEQILDPQSWLEREGFAKVGGTGAGEILGERWQLIGGGEAGEVDAILTLEIGAEPSLARLAGDGWDGGRYEAWMRGGDCKALCRGRTVGLISFRFEGGEDRTEFDVAAENYARDGLGGKPTPREGAFTLDGGGAVAYASAGDAGALAYAPSPRLAARLAERAARAASAAG